MFVRTAVIVIAACALAMSSGAHAFTHAVPTLCFIEDEPDRLYMINITDPNSDTGDVFRPSDHPHYHGEEPGTHWHDAWKKLKESVCRNYNAYKSEIRLCGAFLPMIAACGAVFFPGDIQICAAVVTAGIGFLEYKCSRPKRLSSQVIDLPVELPIV